jgi:Zn finger protein HypA/HybF involved in hydrogenase expression
VALHSAEVIEAAAVVKCLDCRMKDEGAVFISEETGEPECPNCCSDRLAVSS